MRQRDLKSKVLYVISRRRTAGRCTCAQCVAERIGIPAKNVHRVLTKYLDQYLVVRKKQRAEEHRERYYGLYQYMLTGHGVKRLRYLVSQRQVHIGP